VNPKTFFIALCGVLSGFLIFMVAAPLPASVQQPVLETMKRNMDKKIEAHQKQIDAEVTQCLSNESPWRCFIKLRDSDGFVPVPRAAIVSRVQRLAETVTAKDVLFFCSEPRKIDCAEQMIGKGYSREVIQAALETFNEN
jgi:hypothetical protein